VPSSRLKYVFRSLSSSTVSAAAEPFWYVFIDPSR